jgi:7-cyano-7-deazaguanine synthase in queuosine biosynthesis
MTTLAMFSGGLDSTAMLVRLLTRGEDELRVHHIRMVNREGRDGAEQAAVEPILAYCRAHYRPFRY